MGDLLNLLMFILVFRPSEGLGDFSEDYILTFTEQTTSRVLATAAEMPGTVRLRFPSNAIKSYTLTPWEYSVVKVNGSVILDSGIEEKTVIAHVEDTQMLQIRGQNNFGTYTPIPISDLGTRYIVSSCFPSYVSYFKAILVVATHSLPADISITFKTNGSISYGGMTYNDGDTLSVNLAKYHTFTLRNIRHDITGTIVESSQSVAVFSGSTPGSMYGYEQMLPSNRLGRDFVLAVYNGTSNRRFHLTVVTENENSQLKFNDGVEAVIDKNVHYERLLEQGEVLHFTTSHPVQATICREFGFTIIPPVSLLPRNVIIYNSIFENKLLSRTPDDVTVSDWSEISVPWHDIPNSDFKVASVKTNTGVMVVRSHSAVSVFVFTGGVAYNAGYDFSGTKSAAPEEISTISKVQTREGIQASGAARAAYHREVLAVAFSLLFGLLTMDSFI